MKRAFARLGDQARFLLDSTDPTHVFAEEICAQVSSTTGLLHWNGWHSAGKVAIADLRKASRGSLRTTFATSGRCTFKIGPHAVSLPGRAVAALLVELDRALEAGVPVNRKLRDLGGKS